MPTVETPKLSRKDFVSDQEVRWCPGCGDYAILAQTQKLMPELGVPRENIVFISGIGCSSRFPYYMDTYGFHSIHGRAPTFATGLKITNPELLVFVITGDGDGLSIGGNHLIHALRRNIDLNIILFNNQIYGLTKGQYSPTSEVGKVTKSSPVGSLDRPVNPIKLALAAECSFVARTVDRDTKHLVKMIERAAKHEGGSFIEVYQNCPIYNDGAFEHFSDRAVRDEKTVTLDDGQPLIFGKSKDKGIKLDGFQPVVCAADDPDILIHSEKNPNSVIYSILAQMGGSELPVPLGVFRSMDWPTYDDELERQIVEARAEKGEGDLAALLDSGSTWDVE